MQAQSTLTQLIFEHALRIRLKADGDTATSKKRSETSSDATPVEPESAAEEHARTLDSEVTLDGEQRSTAESSTATSAKGKNDEKPAITSSKDSNMIGKINNMISTDVNSLEGGQGWILIGAHTMLVTSGIRCLTCAAVWFTPLQISLSLVFLYAILGWRYVSCIQVSFFRTEHTQCAGRYRHNDNHVVHSWHRRKILSQISGQEDGEGTLSFNLLLHDVASYSISRAMLEYRLYPKVQLC